VNAHLNNLYEPKRLAEIGLPWNGTIYDKGRVWVNSSWGELLKENSFSCFESFYNFNNPEHVKKKKDRRIMAFSLKGGGRFFLKQHQASSNPMNAGGTGELRNIMEVRSAGILTPDPVAAGYDLETGKSFLLTAAVHDGVPLDRFIAEDAASVFNNNTMAAFMKKLAICLGELVRTFHLAGFNHRDLYLCHVFINSEAIKSFPDSEGRVELTLLDLQRVDYRKHFRARWIIKDLAQLLYSTKPLAVSRTDIFRFALSYFGVNALSGQQLTMGRRISAKSRKIARHDYKRISRLSGRATS